MERFKSYLLDPCPQNRPSAKELAAMELQYPWFVAPRAVRSVLQGRIAPQLVVSMQMGKCSSLLMKKIEPQEFVPTPKIDVIGKFLEKGDYRIIPRDDTPDYHADSEPSPLSADDSVTEDLAAIFLSQGLNEQAKASYRKLSLLYPEKSAYFAEIIANIENNKN